MTSDCPATHRQYASVLATVLTALAATRFAPIATPALMLLLCYFPGRIVVRAAELAPGWDAAGRCVLSVAISLAVAPVMLNLIWHFTNNPWVLLVTIWVLLHIGLWVAGRRKPNRTDLGAQQDKALCLFDHKSTKVVAAALTALVAFATIGPYWPTEVQGYPVPALIHDFVKHHAVLFSLERHSLPLGNPFYADGATGPVYYYHYFYLIPATVRAVSAGLSIELAFGLHGALVGIATVAMFYLITKRFTGGDGPATLAALLASAVGALDIIPIMVLHLRTVHLDAWADVIVRIHNFLNQMTWSPQNVLGLLIGLVGVYILSLKGWWRGWFLLGPILGVAMLGSSVWIAMGMFAGLAVFISTEAVSARKRKAHLIRQLALSGAVGLLMLATCVPSLLEYSEMKTRHGQGLTLEWPYQVHAIFGPLAPPGVIANILDLPWLLAVELGPRVLFLPLLPRSIWRRAWNDPGLRFLLLSSVVALVGFVTLRSHFACKWPYNDFGQKIIMIPMAGGAILAACVLRPGRGRLSLFNPLGWRLHEHPSGRPRTKTAWFVGLMLLAGSPVVFWEVPIASLRRHLSPEGPLAVAAHRDARRFAAEGQAYRFLRYELPESAVIQADWGDERVRLVQIARKQLGVTILQEDTMVFYPPDKGVHQRCLLEVSKSLSESGDAGSCNQVLRRHGITHLFVGWIEKQRWSHLEKVDDSRYFDLLFDSSAATVYAVKQPVPASSRQTAGGGG